MKKLVLFGLALLMLVPTVDARRKKPKAGKIQDNIYHDTKYNFELTIHERWKPRVSKAEENLRLVLTQKGYAIPDDYKDAPDYTTVPRLALYVDTTSLSAHAFVDSLVSDNYKSDQKKDIVKEFDFLQERDIIPKGRRRIEIGGESGVFWKAESKYVKEVSTSASSVGGKRVGGSYGGGIVLVKHEKNIVILYLMCEWPFFDDVLVEVETMIKSFKWVEAEE